MTPEAQESKWVRREILYAQRENKPIFPLLLRGKEFPLLIEIQYVDVRNEQVPPKGFYQRLARAVPRQATEDFTLPLLEWCYIPGKSVKIIDKVDSVDSYYMAKYPVTNGQYSAFVADTDGYSNPRWGVTRSVLMNGIITIEPRRNLVSQKKHIHAKWSHGMRQWHSANG
jgi:hypothetical protein